jgi:hypothetical protein
MTSSGNQGTLGVLLEAEVAPNKQADFEGRYRRATGIAVTPRNPVHYQNQPGKWGAELRVYFNDPGMKVVLEAMGIHVEYPRNGYMAGQYQYRVNNNDLWWKLVENFGLLLGSN